MPQIYIILFYYIMSNPSATTSGNGSVFSNGYAMGQNAAIKQNEMNNALSGGRIRKGKIRFKSRGGGVVEVQPVHAPYPNSGIQAINTDLTKVSAQQQANSQYDGNVNKSGGSRRRRRRSIKRRKTNRRSRRIRKSRRHM
jgi:hypothetical protein